MLATGFRTSKKLATGLLAASLSLTWLVSLPSSQIVTAQPQPSGRQTQRLAYVTYDDSGFTGVTSRSGNIFADAISDGPASTSSADAAVNYLRSRFTPMKRADLSTATLANFDTLLLFQVCNVAKELSNTQLAAVNTFANAGNKVLLFDGDRCAPNEQGQADYTWLRFPLLTSSPGPGSNRSTSNPASKLEVVEQSGLSQNLASDDWSSDELADANTAKTADPGWCAVVAATNGLGNRGFFLAYGRTNGLIIYNGADYWATGGEKTKARRDLFVNMLRQPFAPDALACQVKLVDVANAQPQPTPSPTSTPTATASPTPTVTASPTVTPTSTPQLPPMQLPLDTVSQSATSGVDDPLPPASDEGGASEETPIDILSSAP